MLFLSEAELGDSGNYTCYTKQNNMTAFVDVICKCMQAAAQCYAVSAGAVLSRPHFGGSGESEVTEVEGDGHRQNFVGHTFKYAVFDMKPTRNR